MNNLFSLYIEQDVEEIYQRVVDDFGASDLFDEDDINDFAVMISEDISSDMDKYLHMEDHHIVGNFSNVRTDYEREHVGEPFRELVERWDAQKSTERDTQWLREWFWDAFGTFGIRYNFESFVSDSIYEYEQEKEIAL